MNINFRDIKYNQELIQGLNSTKYIIYFDNLVDSTPFNWASNFDESDLSIIGVDKQNSNNVIYLNVKNIIDPIQPSSSKIIKVYQHDQGLVVYLSRSPEKQRLVGIIFNYLKSNEIYYIPASVFHDIFSNQKYEWKYYQTIDNLYVDLPIQKCLRLS